MLMASETLQNSAMHSLVPADDPDIDLRYFVLFTEPMGERKAAGYLKDAGFNPWVPLYQRTMIYHVRKWGRLEPRSRRVPWPIFCGYLFLPLNRAWSFGPIERCPWLRQSGNKFMNWQGHYKTLSDKEFAQIKAAEALANFSESYQVGDQVTILSGAFAGELGEISRLDDASRITLLVDIFNGRFPAIVSADQIAKADQ
jgi:hypothetical protein